MIRAVIFDLGRTLVRIHVSGPLFGRLMRAMGVAPERAFSDFWNVPEVIAHMTGTLSSRDFYHAARDRFGLKHTYEEFVAGWCDIFEADPAMEDLFLRTAARLDVGLLSDTDPMHWEYLLHRLPWLAKAANPTLSFRVGKLKPDPAMFLAAARDCGRAPEECLFIDDLAANVAGAERCGMRAVRFEGAEHLAGILRDRIFQRESRER